MTKRSATFAPFIVLLLLLDSSASSAQEAATGLSRHDTVHQLRIYEIFEENKEAFHDRFRDHAARIMAKYDFKIVAMWESKFEDRTEFVYLLAWPDEKTMQNRWQKFLADAEWSSIKKQTRAAHGELVGSIQDRTLHSTDYSPSRLTGGSEPIVR